MSLFSRREVLSGLSAGALGLLALNKGGSVALAGMGHVSAGNLPELAARKNRTSLHYLFCAKPKGLEGWPYHQYDHAARAEYFTRRLKQIGDIDWSGGEIIEREEDLQGLKSRLDGKDGLVVIALTSPAVGLGALSDMGLTTPVLLFNDLFCGDCSFLGYQQRAMGKGLRLVSLSSEDMGLLERKLQLLRAAARLRRSKIICFRERGDQNPDFTRTAAEKLGVELIYMGSAEINAAYEKADKARAKEIAGRWIEAAEKVVEPKTEEIVDSARMYLALSSLMQQEQANAVTVDCLTMVYGKKISAYPCLAFVQMNDEGYVGACESDLAATLTMLVVGYLADRPGFMSDPVLDTEAGLIYHAHCLSATRMSGLEGPAEPCVIRSHSEDRSGVSLEVKFTPGHKITAAKYVPFDKMLVSTGEIVGNKSTELACRSKMVTRVDKEGVRKMLNGYSGGLHRIIFYGDHVEDLEDLGRLLDFQVVNETA